MTMKEHQDIISEFEEFIDYLGGKYPRFYVGITDNPPRRLHGSGEHNVSMYEEYLFRKAGDSDAARLIEHHFLEQGCDGGQGGGDGNSTYIYIYLKTPFTRP